MSCSLSPSSLYIWAKQARARERNCRSYESRDRLEGRRQWHRSARPRRARSARRPSDVGTAAVGMLSCRPGVDWSCCSEGPGAPRAAPKQASRGTAACGSDPPLLLCAFSLSPVVRPQHTCPNKQIPRLACMSLSAPATPCLVQDADEVALGGVPAAARGGGGGRGRLRGRARRMGVRRGTDWMHGRVGVPSPATQLKCRAGTAAPICVSSPVEFVHAAVAHQRREDGAEVVACVAGHSRSTGGLIQIRQTLTDWLKECEGQG